MSAFRKLTKHTEFFIALTILVLCLLIGFTNSAFFSLGNLFDLLRSSVEMGILALGALVVIISGGIDVSFTAIAVFALYVTAKVMTTFQGSVVWAFLMAGGVGVLLGLFNAVFISVFKLPTLIVTLGTSSVFRGVMLVFIGTYIVNELPQGMLDFARATLFQVPTSAGGMVGLPFSVLLLVISSVAVWLLLRYTMLGRGIYALGGDPVGARRAGFNLVSIQFFIYGLVGFLSGIAGIVHGAMVRNANPFDLIGTELNVIAAVVLGWARITGGEGSVVGTLLGVLLVVIMNNSLILLGVPSYWQRVVVGLLIVAGTGIATYQSQREVSVDLMED